jgi:hypothetical protein
VSCQTPVNEPTAIQEDTFKTLVAGTLTAVAGEALQTQAALPTETSTDLPTSTAAPTLTPTKEIVRITITKNVNCRKGASTIFPVKATLTTGMEIVVLGRNKDGDYLYVQNPNDPTEGCWIFGETGLVTGPPDTLPVYTPQPTAYPTATPTLPPTPQFSVTFAGLTTCGAGWAANFNIGNNGDLVLQSIRIRNTPDNTTTAYVHTSNLFTQWSGGAEYLKQADLVKGEQAIVSACTPGQFDFDPIDKLINAEITICTKDDLLGTCTTQLLAYKPH